MSTITGTIEDAEGNVLNARIDFISKSTPLAGSGIVTTNTDTTIRSDPSTGRFSAQLAAGNYQVVIAAQGQTTTFNIAVPNDNNTYPIDQVVSTPLAYTFVAPNTVWNGQRAGHITFLPIATPGAPTLLPGDVPGGAQTNVDQSSYCVIWQNANGDSTLAGPAAANSPPTAPNNVTRVFLPTPPSGVTNVLVYRSTDAGATFHLEETVSPNTTFYNSSMSNAQFNTATGIFPGPPLPVFNSTAGGVFSSIGNIAFYVTDTAVFFPGSNFRLKPGKGLQLYNADTQLWHTITAGGNPAQLGLDAGQS